MIACNSPCSIVQLVVIFVSILEVYLDGHFCIMVQYEVILLLLGGDDVRMWFALYCSLNIIVQQQNINCNTTRLVIYNIIYNIIY